MNIMRTCHIRCTPTNGGFTNDQSWFGGFRLSGGRSGIDRLSIVPINWADDIPTIGFKATCRIVFEPTIDMTINRDAVVIIETNEFVESPNTCERTNLMANALHQATIA